MFDFIRKSFLWAAWDEKLDAPIKGAQSFHLKSIQDLAVWAELRNLKGKSIAEIGGGDSRLLRALAGHNHCLNIEKFEGADGGPAKVIEIPQVTNVLAFLGEFSPAVADESLDAVFSVSVVEHVPDNNLADFLEDGLRALKSGGLWLHAIDLYLQDEPTPASVNRFERYKAWMTGGRLIPLGEIFDGPCRFTCDMATNPDNVMYSWGRISPTLIPLRQKAQSVSLILAGRKA